MNARFGGIGPQCLDAGSGGSTVGNFTLEDALLPALPAFNSSNYSSWGGSVIRGDDDQYHMFAAVFQNGKGLNSWTTDSEIMHAVADTPEGPFKMKNIVEQPFAHNPQITRAYDGTYLLFMIGGSKLASATSLDGPWTPVPDFPSCNNPAPVTNYSDGSGLDSDHIYVVCHGGPTNNHWGISVEMYEAPHWLGPWSTVRRNNASKDVDLYDHGTALFAHPVEDPTVWVDNSGTWHILTHAFRMGMVNSSGVTKNAYGGYAWSNDGPYGPWHFQENMVAYTGEIQFANQPDTTFVASRRERPKVLIDPTTGRPSHLYSGVCPENTSYSGVSDPNGHCFTMVQKINPSVHLWNHGGAKD